MGADKDGDHTPGWMLDQVYNHVGEFVSLETKEGITREGRLSGLRMTKIKFNGEEVDVIDELELNGDPYDTIKLDRVASLNTK